MALPAVSLYTVAAGQPIHGGRWPGGRLVGNVELAAVLADGVLDTGPSDMGGAVDLSAAVAAGTLAMESGPYTWAAGLSTDAWIELSGTSYRSWATGGGVPSAAYQGSDPIGAMVDAYGDPASGDRHTHFYNGGHGDGTCNAVVTFDRGLLTYSLAVQPTPPAKYPPSYVAGGANQPGPLVYPSGLNGLGYFLDADLLTAPADASYATPVARASTHTYGAAVLVGSTIHYLYNTYGRVNLSTQQWSGRGVSLGAQLATFRPEYGTVPLQQGTVALYDPSTHRIFAALVAGDDGGGWRSGVLVINPDTATIQAVIEYDPAMGLMTESPAMVQVGRRIFFFTHQSTGTAGVFRMDRGVLVEMDVAAAASGLVYGVGSSIKAFTTSGDDIGTLNQNLLVQETMPAWYDGVAIRRWNYEGGRRSSIYSVSPTPASGAGTVASPYVLTQTVRALSGTPPPDVRHVYTRAYYDAAAGAMMLLPSASSNWYAVRMS